VLIGGKTVFVPPPGGIGVQVARPAPLMVQVNPASMRPLKQPSYEVGFPSSHCSPPIAVTPSFKV
jgi:hypothetical protein